MDQGKYLIFIIIIFYIPTSLAFSWLPTSGKYKYSFTTLITDAYSSSLKEIRLNAFREIEEIISSLITEKILIESSALMSFTDSIQIQLIDHQIAKLKRKLSELSSYTNERIIINNIEYGIDNNSSFGMKILTKSQEFINSGHILAKSHSTNNSVSIFYKTKIKEKNLHILTISPQITINPSIFLKDEIFLEMFLVQGISRDLHSEKNIFHETGFSIGSGVIKSCRHKRFYSLLTSQGIKFPNGIIISSYVKYTYSKNNNAVYRETLYEQLAVSRLVQGKAFKNLTLQLGYFWDKSLKNALYSRIYQTSGLIFSINMEL